MPKKQSIDYAALKKGGFMRQKQKNRFSLRLAVVGGTVTAKHLAAVIKTGALVEVPSATQIGKAQ